VGEYDENLEITFSEGKFVDSEKIPSILVEMRFWSVTTAVRNPKRIVVF